MWGKPRPEALIAQALRQKFVVTLPRGEGIFTGVMVDYDEMFWRFEQCVGAPRPGGAAESWPGRIWVKHATSPPPLLQETEPRYADNG